MREFIARRWHPERCSVCNITEGSEHLFEIPDEEGRFHNYCGICQSFETGGMRNAMV